jgi:L-threonylcarbamoyladenylate synthase
VSGLPEARTADEIVEQLGDCVGLVLDGGPAHGGPASTIVDCTVEPPRILRVGAIALEAVEAALGRADDRPAD